MFWCFLAHPVSAEIYKWKDDQGKTHFTDNPADIPEKFRTPSGLGAIKETVPPAQKSAAPAPVTEESPQATLEDAAKLRDFPTAEKAVFEETMKFLKADATRYEEFYDRPRHFRQTFVQLHQMIIDGVPEKKAAIAKLKTFEDNKSFQETAGFLSQTLAEDEKASTMGWVPKLRTTATLERVQNDAQTKTGLIEKLRAEMKIREAEAAKKKELEAQIKQQEQKAKEETVKKANPEEVSAGK